MNTPIRSFVVVGGGTAGWMAACYLNRVFADSGRNDITVTLVESADIGVIGVGEATLPTLRQTMNSLGIPEWKLVADTDATFKHGTKFVNWSYNPAKAPNDFYYHAFESPVVANGYNMMTHWQAMRETGATQCKFHDLAGVQGALFDENLSPKMYNSPPYDAPLPYGYHLDAVKLGHMMRDISVLRSVRHVVDTITRVDVTQDGTITGVVTEKHGTIEGDFFIDCSGFVALLIEKALHEPFIDMADTLLCDRAVAIPVPHAAGNTTLRPYTTSTAKSAGWTWDIDLFTRRGTGYVYSSHFIGDDEAEAELRAHLGPVASQAQARRLRIRPGHRRRSWVGNCLAVGLASSFIEPLESSGIYLVEIALTMFLDYMDGNRGIPALRDKYNSVMNNLFNELSDFIVLHYVTTLRDDTPFWRAYKNDVKPSAALAEKLELWQHKVPGTSDLSERVTVFGPASYFYIMAGMRALPRSGIAIRPYISRDMSQEAAASVQNMRAGAIKSAPNHYDFIKKLRSTAL
jgi:tryptophan halogenase